MNTLTFSAWLRRELRAREWTQAHFARKIGTSSGVVSHWVRGTRVPDPSSCDLIADVLNADVDYVLTLAGHRPNTYDGDDPETKALIQLLRRVTWTAERRKFARSLLEAMVSLDRVEATK